jgi:hypothetical protein
VQNLFGVDRQVDIELLAAVAGDVVGCRGLDRNP